MLYRKLYHFADLSDGAKEKAREWYRDGNDYHFLEEYLLEIVREEMQTQGYEIDGKIDLRYSLSCCQGDGVSFSCTFKLGSNTYEAYTFDNHYVHENTMRVKHIDKDGNESDMEMLTEYLRKIARKAEKAGYKFIESEDSDENVDENIVANEYTFTSEGKRLDPEHD